MSLPPLPSSPTRTTPAAPSTGTAAGGAHAGVPAVVVGSQEELPQLLQGPLLAGDGPLTVCALVPLAAVDEDGAPDTAERVPVAAIQQAVRQHGAGALLVAGTLGPRVMAALGELGIALGCRLLVPAPAVRGGQLAPMVTWVRGVPMLEMVPHPPPRLAAVAKRTMDLLVAGIALVAAAPLLALLAAAIRAESRGNPFFGHERVGVGGRRFRCWKLRTMRADAERQLAEDSALREAYQAHDFKLPDDRDPRITRLGRWLRRSSLDELPQLWNVVVGEMSLVGPRPLVAEELLHFRGAVLELLSVRPGITGAWAVSGRHALTYPRRAEVELAYVRGRSFTGDVGILVRTVGAVVSPGVFKA